MIKICLENLYIARVSDKCYKIVAEIPGEDFRLAFPGSYRSIKGASKDLSAYVGTEVSTAILSARNIP